MTAIKAIRAVEIAPPGRWTATPRRGAPFNPGFPTSRYLERTTRLAPVWVEVTAEDGTIGLGRAGNFGTAVAALVEEHFSPLLVGRDLFATEMLNDLMWLSTKWQGSAGLSAIAQSGIDLALWDLKGKLLGQPVWRLIGGPAREAIHCYASGDVEWSMSLGFDAFKIHNPAYFEHGNAGLDAVEQHVAMARDRIGPSAELMLNVVMAYDVSYAVEVAERLRPYRLHWLEEPLFAEDVDAYAQLKAAIPWCRLATGEDNHTRVPFRQLVERRAVDVIQPDLEHCGGLTEALKIYTIAEAAGIPTSPHVAANSPFGQHFAYALPMCVIAEFYPGPPEADTDEWDLLPGTARPKAGYVVPSDAPGFGFEIPAEWILPHGTRDPAQRAL